MSSTQPSTPTSNTGTHVINGRLGNGDGEAQNTTLTDSETDNINEQAEHGNDRARNSPQGGATQRRRMRVALTISTSTEVAATDGQELGLDDLTTGNDMQAPSAPTHGFNDPTLFGVPQTNHHWAAPPCRRYADNFVNFGISSVGGPTSEPMERLTPLGTTTALSSHPPAREIDDGVPSGGIVLRDFSRDLDEWPDNEEQENGSQHRNTLVQEGRLTPTNEISSLNVGDLRLGTPAAQERLAMLAPFSQYPENETSGAAPGEHTTASN